MQKNVKAIPGAATRALTTWDRPGNIRELENLIERAVILTRGKSLEVPLAGLRKSGIDEGAVHITQRGGEDIARIVRETISALDHTPATSAAAGSDNGRRDEIVRVLRESNGRVGGIDGAAAHMGVKRTTLLSRIKKLGIDPKQFPRRDLDRLSSEDSRQTRDPASNVSGDEARVLNRGDFVSGNNRDCENAQPKESVDDNRGRNAKVGSG